MVAKTAVAKQKTGGALASWETKLAEEAREESAREVSQGRFVSVKGQKFWFAGKELQHPLSVIVMDSIYENARYEGDYDPEAPRSPVCFAFSRDGKDMKPDAASSQPQSETCAKCKWNQFGTADRGKGKGCKNTRRLALMMPGSLEDIASAEIAYYRPPVTSVKNWSKYATALDKIMNRPACSVVTTMEIKPDAKTQFEILFRDPQKLDLSNTFDAMQAKRASIKDEIAFPYQAQAEVTEEQKPARKVKYR